MKRAHQLGLALLASFIATTLMITACGGGSDGDELTLSGQYTRGGFLKAGTTSSWAALGQANYNKDGTGTLSYSHSAFGPLSGLSIVYALDTIGTLFETVSLPNAAGESSNGAVASDKEVMIVIDDDEEDGLRGLEAGVRTDSGSVRPKGDYIQIGYYDLAKGNRPVAVYSVSTFNENGTGLDIFESSLNSSSSSYAFTYTVGQEGGLAVQYENSQRVTVNLLGAITSDKSVMVLVDNDQAENVVGMQLGIRKSSGMSAASLKGKYHLFMSASFSGTKADTALVEFDGKGGAVLSDFGVMSGDIPAEYTVAEDGTFEMTAQLLIDRVTWRGGVREGGSMFAAADIVPGASVGILAGIAQWQE